MKTVKATEKDMSELYKIILKLKTPAETKNFFQDLCTISELNSMAERWKVVKMLEKNISYREISKETGSSTATVTRIAHWFYHGMGGYKLALKRSM